MSFAFILIATVAFVTLVLGAQRFPVVPEETCNIIQNIHKVFSINGRTSSTFELTEPNIGIKLYWNDLVCLAKRQITVSTLLKSIQSIIQYDNAAFHLLIYNTLLEKYENTTDANAQIILNSKLAVEYNVFLLGSVIKDEYGMKKTVMNAIFIVNPVKNYTYSLEWDMHCFKLKEDAERIQSRAPRHEIPEKIKQVLNEVYDRNEQLLQLYLQLVHETFTKNPYELCNALLGNWLTKINPKKLKEFSIKFLSDAPMAEVAEYFRMNWVNFTNYQDAVFHEKQVKQVEEYSYCAIKAKFPAIEEVIKKEFEGIVRLKNYWALEATGLNAVIQALCHSISFRQLLIWLTAEHAEPISKAKQIIHQFNDLLDYMSNPLNSLTIKDTTKLFDLLAANYDTLYNTEFGYDLSKLILIIFKEITLECFKYSNQHPKHQPYLFVRGAVEIDECFPLLDQKKNSIIEFEYLTLGIHQFHQTGIFSINHFLTNALFGFKNVVPIPEDKMLTQHLEIGSQQKKMKFINYPSVLLVLIEDGPLMECHVNRLLKFTNEGQYSLAAVISMNEEREWCTFIPDGKKNIVSQVANESVSVAELTIRISVDREFIGKATLVEVISHHTRPVEETAELQSTNLKETEQKTEEGALAVSENINLQQEQSENFNEPHYYQILLNVTGMPRIPPQNGPLFLAQAQLVEHFDPLTKLTAIVETDVTITNAVVLLACNVFCTIGTIQAGQVGACTGTLPCFLPSCAALQLKYLPPTGPFETVDGPGIALNSSCLCEPQFIVKGCGCDVNPEEFIPGDKLLFEFEINTTVKPTSYSDFTIYLENDKLCSGKELIFHQKFLCCKLSDQISTYSMTNFTIPCNWNGLGLSTLLLTYEFENPDRVRFHKTATVQINIGFNSICNILLDVKRVKIAPFVPKCKCDKLAKYPKDCWLEDCNPKLLSARTKNVCNEIDNCACPLASCTYRIFETVDFWAFTRKYTIDFCLPVGYCNLVLTITALGRQDDVIWERRGYTRIVSGAPIFLTRWMIPPKYFKVKEIVAVLSYLAFFPGGVRMPMEIEFEMKMNNQINTGCLCCGPRGECKCEECDIKTCTCFKCKCKNCKYVIPGCESCRSSSCSGRTTSSCAKTSPSCSSSSSTGCSSRSSKSSCSEDSSSSCGSKSSCSDDSSSSSNICSSSSSSDSCSSASSNSSDSSSSGSSESNSSKRSKDSSSDSKSNTKKDESKSCSKESTETTSEHKKSQGKSSDSSSESSESDHKSKECSKEKHHSHKEHESKEEHRTHKEHESKEEHHSKNSSHSRDSHSKNSSPSREARHSRDFHHSKDSHHSKNSSHSKDSHHSSSPDGSSASRSDEKHNQSEQGSNSSSNS